MRYLPEEERSNDMFGWHHDMEDRRMKMMVLLTDVGPGDQHMSYVRGSHRLMHPIDMFHENDCSLDYCAAALGEIDAVDAIGQAGDVFLFDSNGAHRGNRKPEGAVRDVLMVEFTSDPSDVWGGDLAPGSLDGLPPELPNPFHRLVNAGRKWERDGTRALPEWMNNLPHPDRWL
jgi:hypothetical protein